MQTQVCSDCGSPILEDDDNFCGVCIKKHPKSRNLELSPNPLLTQRRYALEFAKELKSINQDIFEFNFA